MRQNHRAPLLSLLGLARRAGKLSLGNDAAVESLRKGQARLVLLASDLSPRSRRGIAAAAQQAEAPCRETGASMEEIARAIGKHTGILAVNDEGFSKKIEQLCSEPTQ